MRVVTMTTGIVHYRGKMIVYPLVDQVVIMRNEGMEFVMRYVIMRLVILIMEIVVDVQRNGCRIQIVIRNVIIRLVTLMVLMSEMEIV